MKTGLVMEGGAMRGMYTNGIIDVFMENGITFDGAIGVSAGAGFGCNYKSNQPGRAIRYNLRYAKDPRYCSVASLLFTGDMYGAKFCYETIPYKTDLLDTFTYRSNPMKFYVVVTDVQSGEPVYKELKTMDHEEAQWLRASCSMPMASRIVTPGDGHGYLDGGCSDAIPLKKFREMGYDKTVTILTQPEGYVKGKQKALGAMKRSLGKSAPGVVEKMKTRHIWYNEETAYVKEQEELGNTLVFRPTVPLPIKHVTHDRDKLQQAYDLGRKEAEERLEEVKAFLGQ